MSAPCQADVLDRPAAGEVRSLVRRARLAQPAWAATSLRDRLRVLRRFRGLAAEQARQLGILSAQHRRRPLDEVLTAEVVPLLDAVRYLERDARRVLAVRRLGRAGRPPWLFGVRSEVRRDALGVVLIIGPANYPLFLPGVQAVQALAAGNAVLVKPGERGGRVMQLVADLLHHAGLDHRLIQVLPEPPWVAAEAIEEGVDKVFLTGSARTGRTVRHQLARKGTPSVMELSGCDAVFVREDADLDLAVRALRFGTLLNNGATCIAPRRVFVHRAIATELEGRLARAFAGRGTTPSAGRLKPEWAALLNEAFAQGAHLVSGSLGASDQYHPPLILAGASPAMRLLQRDIFAPVLSLITVTDDHDALERARQCPYALGATVFSRDWRKALRFAGSVRAGCVVINDMIVPTADPRVPFAGRDQSGFGATRGPEGLLELTAPKVVALRRSSWLPHLEPARAGDDALFCDYLMTAHGRRIRPRVGAALSLVGRLFRRHRSARPPNRTLAGSESQPTERTF